MRPSAATESIDIMEQEETEETEWWLSLSDVAGWGHAESTNRVTQNTPRRGRFSRL